MSDSDLEQIGRDRSDAEVGDIDGLIDRVREVDRERPIHQLDNVRVRRDHVYVEVGDRSQLLTQGIEPGRLDPVVVGDQNPHPATDSRLTRSYA